MVITGGAVVYMAAVGLIFGQGQPSASVFPGSFAASTPASAPAASGQAAAVQKVPDAAAQSAAGSGADLTTLHPAVPPIVIPSGMPPIIAGANGTHALNLPASSDASSSPTNAPNLVDSQTMGSIMRRTYGALVERGSSAQRSHPSSGSSGAAYPTLALSPAASPTSSGMERPSPANGNPSSSAASARQPLRLQPTDKPTLLALESAQRKAANGVSGLDAENTALAAIVHGGKAVFAVQYLNASTGVSHPAQIVVTAATLAFLPQAAGEPAALTIPLESIASVRMAPAVSGRAGDLLSIEFNNPARPGPRARLTFRDSPALLPGPQSASPSSFHPSTTPLVRIRNVILATQGFS